MANDLMGSGGPIVHVREGVAYTNSRDVAAYFSKRHDNVLAGIDALDLPLELRRAWFFETTYDDGNGRRRRSVEMTRDGFTILVMGYTGSEAMQFKVRYIAAFNQMERSLHETVSISANLDGLLSRLVALQEKAFVDIQAVNVGQMHVSGKVDVIERDLRDVKQTVSQIVLNQDTRRRRFSPSTCQQIVQDTADLGGRCPCCSVAIVVENGQRTRFSEIDHFYSNSRTSPDAGWLICKPCHSDLTNGRVPRDQRETQFKNFQEQRRRLPGRQPRLFG